MDPATLSEQVTSMKDDLLISAIHKGASSFYKDDELIDRAFQLANQCVDNYLEVLGDTIDDISEDEFEFGADLLSSLISGGANYKAKQGMEGLAKRAITIYVRVMEKESTPAPPQETE